MSRMRLSTQQCAVALWLVLFSLGSPVLPDARYVKFLLMLYFTYRIFADTPKNKFHRKSMALALIVGLLIMWATASAQFNSYLIAQRVVLNLIGALAGFALGSMGSKNLQRSFATSSLIALSFGWLLSLLGLVPMELKSDYKLLGLPYRFSGIFTTPNAAGLIALLCLISLAMQKDYYRKFLFLIPIVTLIGTEYRGGVIALAACYLWVQVTRIPALPAQQALATYAKVLFFGVGVFWFLPLVTSARSANSDSTSGRTMIWRQCQILLSNVDVLGYGPETVARYFGLDERYGSSKSGAFQFYHCHNLFLNTVVEYGYVFLVVLCALFAIVLLSAYRRRDMAAQLIVVAILCAGLFETPLKFLGSQNDSFPVVLFCALLFVTSSTRRNEMNQEHNQHEASNEQSSLQLRKPVV